MIDPVLVSGIVADGIAALILAAIWHAHREIRGRVLPLCVLTLLHAILVLLCLCCDSGAVVGVLRALFFSPHLFCCCSVSSTRACCPNSPA